MTRVRLAEPYVDDEIRQAVLEVIDSRNYVDGEYTRRFEEMFSNYIGVKESVAVSSGTSSLYLILKALGVGKGDKVAVPSFTFIATASQVVEVGATPIFIDVDLDTMTMDPNDLETKMDDDVKAVIPVHLFGHPADLEHIVEVSEKYGAYVIEDAAQAHGALYKDSKVGGLGDVGYFSLYPSKNLGVYGEGGIVTTNDVELAEKIRALKNHGIVDGEIKMFGYNMKFSEINAVVAIHQLEKLDNWNNIRRRNARLYNERLSKSQDLEIPIEKEWALHVYNLYTIKTLFRDKVAEALKRENISYGIYYSKPIHMMNIVRERFGYVKLRNTEKLKDLVISIPVHQFLSEENVLHISDVILRAVDST